jgi:hypothetical protein
MTSDANDKINDNNGLQKNGRPTVKFRRRPVRTQRVSPGLLILAAALLIAIILLLRWVAARS